MLNEDMIVSPVDIESGVLNKLNGQTDCATCAPHHPGPQSAGNLQVDPEIRLPSPGMDVSVSYFYNSGDRAVGPYGYGRTISCNHRLTARENHTHVQMLRGDGSGVQYKQTEPGKYELNADLSWLGLSLKQENGQWVETNSDGVKTFYPVVEDGKTSKVSYIEDSVGNRHTYTYDSNGLLTTLTDTVGRKVTFTYSSNNLLSEITDWAGRKNLFTYDTTTNPRKPVLIKVTGPTGCQTKYKHNDEGLLSGIIDPNGYETNYKYDKQGRVISRSIVGIGETKYDYDFTALSGTGQYTRVVTDALGYKTTEVYDKVHRLVSSTSPMGRVTSTDRNLDAGVHTSYLNGLVDGVMTFDAKGNLTSSSSADGLKTSYTYDEFGNRTSTTLPDGATSKLVWGFPGSEFDETGAKRRVQIEIDQYGHEARHSYNEFGKRTKALDIYDTVTSFKYDGFGNLISKSDSLGNSWTAKYDAAGNVTEKTENSDVHPTKTEYDARDRPVRVTDPRGNVTQVAYDGNGNKVVQIDALGHRWEWTYNVWDEQDTSKSPMGSLTRQVYDKLGRLISTIDPLGNKNSTEYNADGQVAALLNPLGYKTSYEYDAEGRNVAVVDAAGNKTQFLYDEYGRQSGSIDALGNRTSVAYDAVGRAFQQTDALGNVTTTLYDQLGREAGQIDALGNKSERLYDSYGRTCATIDPLGNKTAFIFDDFGRMTTMIDALGRESKFEYGPDGRVVSSSVPTGQDIRPKQVRDGNRTITSDALGNKSETTSDALGRVIAVTNPLGHTVAYGYDPDGRKVSESDGNGRITRLDYDPAGRRTAVVDSVGNRTAFTYNAANKIVSVTDASGHTTKYEYDKIGNTTKAISPTGDWIAARFDPLNRENSRTSGTGEVFEFDYDANGNKTAERGPTGTTTFAYDAAGRLSTVIHADGRKCSYKYNAIGRRTEMADVLGGKTAYGYDAIGRQMFVANHRGETTRFEYIDTDNRTIILHSNGTKCVKSFDRLGREINREEIGKGGSVYASFGSTYDAVGQRTMLTEHDGSITHYTYDAAGQLVSEIRSGGKHSWKLLYEYDPAGNRVKKIENGESTTYSYGKANQLIKEVKPDGNSIRFAYDEGGRLIEEHEGQHVTRRKWNSEGRLVALEPHDAYHESYAYNANGIRVKKTIGSQSSYFTLDGQNVVAETKPNGKPIAEWTHSSDSWGGLISEHRESKTYTFAFDPSSSMRSLSDADGLYTAPVLYDAFGAERSNTADVVTPFRYAAAYGYHHEVSSDCYYVRDRYLDVLRGRWISNDRLGFNGPDRSSNRYLGNGFSKSIYANLYQYAFNNPVNEIDPSGLAPTTPPSKSWWECLDCYTLAGGCEVEARRLLTLWDLTWQHVCAHPAMHCNTCCILRKTESADCATQAQKCQDCMHPGGAATTTARTTYCKTGIALAGAGGTCSQQCSSRYPIRHHPSGVPYSVSADCGCKVDCKKSPGDKIPKTANCPWHYCCGPDSGRSGKMFG